MTKKRDPAFQVQTLQKSIAVWVEQVRILQLEKRALKRSLSVANKELWHLRSRLGEQKATRRASTNRMTSRERAAKGWGQQIPEWVAALAAACDERTQAHMARALRLPPTAVHQVLNRNYSAPIGVFRARFEKWREEN